MAYVFSNDNTATLKFEPEGGNKLTVKNISGTEASADVIIKGVQCLLWIVDKEDNYNPLSAYRTVTQNVEDDA